LNADDVLAAVAQCAQFLEEVVDADWSVPIPDMDWSPAQAVAHTAGCLLWYAVDLLAGATELSTMDLRIKSESAPVELIRTLVTAARVVARVIEASASDIRGYHPWGQPDPAGYAAMSCDELLIHTDDAGRGLDRTFEPDPALCARVAARLFPNAPLDAEPWDGLRWANGRIALPGRPRQQEWRWHAAPRE
jgi:hypothetical protein